MYAKMGEMYHENPSKNLSKSQGKGSVEAYKEPLGTRQQKWQKKQTEIQK